MEKLVETVECGIAKVLSEKFGIIIDGWTEGSDHFMAIFATYAKSDFSQQRLLAMSSMGEKLPLPFKPLLTLSSIHCRYTGKSSAMSLF